MITGSCLCGAARFRLDGPAELLNLCHCSMCRKISGSAFGAFLHAPAGGFSWVAGEELVTQFQSSADNVRAFCRVCGSSMPVVEAPSSHVILPAGALDVDPGVRPAVHIFIASKAPWYEISDALPQFDEFPPDTWRPDKD